MRDRESEEEVKEEIDDRVIAVEEKGRNKSKFESIGKLIFINEK